jgi:hypothetical protein
LKRLRAALAAKDFTVIQKIAHNCKGIGRGYGFPEISEIGAASKRPQKLKMPIAWNNPWASLSVLLRLPPAIFLPRRSDYTRLI